MPLYEYRCISCSKIFTKLAPFSKSGDPAPCPDCLQICNRILSVPAPAIVPGGTYAQRGALMTLGDFNDNNDWINA